MGWHQRIPAGGPDFSLQSYPGCLALTTPGSGTYDAWSDTDNVPELLANNSGIADGNWMATTRLTLQKIPSGGGVLAGLVVRIPAATGTTLGKTQLFWGIWDPKPNDPVQLLAGSTYNVTATGSQIAVVKGVPSTVTLRLINQTVPDASCRSLTRYVYTFAYELDGQAGFTAMPEKFERCEGITDLGLFSRISGAPRQTTTVFDWFDYQESLSDYS